MATMTRRTAPLSQIVASNVRAECARRGITQADLAARLGMARITVSDRHRARTPWGLDELAELADVFGLEVEDLVARPKGFEPLTFWLGAEHTVTVGNTQTNGGLEYAVRLGGGAFGKWAPGFFWGCDLCGMGDHLCNGPGDAVHRARRHWLTLHSGETFRELPARSNPRLSSVLAERYPRSGR